MRRKPAAVQRKKIDGALLDVATASAFLGCSERSLRARVARQLVPFRKLDARIVFRRCELEAFLDALPGVSVMEARANSRSRS